MRRILLTLISVSKSVSLSLKCLPGGNIPVEYLDAFMNEVSKSVSLSLKCLPSQHINNLFVIGLVSKSVSLSLKCLQDYLILRRWC